MRQPSQLEKKFFIVYDWSNKFSLLYLISKFKAFLSGVSGHGIIAKILLSDLAIFFLELYNNFFVFNRLH